MILKIVKIKDPVLRQKAKVVKKIDKKIAKLIEDMKETLVAQKDPEGVGLAAPQVGKSLRIFIMHYPEGGINCKAVINPRVIKKSKIKKRKQTKRGKKKEKQLLEGCLSLPHYYGPVERVKEITIEYLDEKGEKQRETMSGFPAQIIGHEIDHLEGKLFVDHIIEQKAPMYFVRGEDYQEVEL